MRPEEFAKSITFLCNAYRQEMNNTQVSVWYNFFRDVPLSEFNVAIARVIEKHSYFPSIAQIRQEIALIKNPALQLDAAEEWEKVLKMISRYGSYQADVAMQEMNPVTAAVVKRMGGFTAICQSDDIEWRRKSFMSIFKETMEGQLHIASYGGNRLTEVERKRKELISDTLALLEKKNE